MTLNEIAKEYRETAAMLAMAIAEHERKKDIPSRDIEIMRAMLRDVRTALRAVSAYYVLPRSGELDSSSWHAGRRRSSDN